MLADLRKPYRPGRLCHENRAARHRYCSFACGVAGLRAADSFCYYAGAHVCRENDPGAQLVVRARCVANSSAWHDGEIWTFTSFTVEDAWKGAPSGAAQRLTVRLLGGSVGNLSSTVSGVPRFRPGEEVILFLQPTARGDYSIVSWVQGTFRIHRDGRSGVEIVVQDTAAFDTYDPATQQFDAEGIRNLPVGALRMRVQSALVAQSGEKK